MYKSKVTRGSRAPSSSALIARRSPSGLRLLVITYRYRAQEVRRPADELIAARIIAQLALVLNYMKGRAVAQLRSTELSQLVGTNRNDNSTWTDPGTRYSVRGIAKLSSRRTCPVTSCERHA